MRSITLMSRYIPLMSRVYALMSSVVSLFIVKRVMDSFNIQSISIPLLY